MESPAERSTQEKGVCAWGRGRGGMNKREPQKCGSIDWAIKQKGAGGPSDQWALKTLAILKKKAWNWEVQILGKLIQTNSPSTILKRSSFRLKKNAMFC